MILSVPAYADETLLKAEAGTLIWTEPLAGSVRAVVQMSRRRGLLEPLRRLFVPSSHVKAWLVAAELDVSSARNSTLAPDGVL